MDHAATRAANEAAAERAPAVPVAPVAPAVPVSRSVEATAVVYGRSPASARTLAVPVEMPVEIAYGGVPFAVMMLTPQDLEDFAVGFSLSEGVIAERSDIRGVSAVRVEAGMRVDVSLAPDRMARHLGRRRAITGRTGCGVCGIEDLAAFESRPRREVSGPIVSVEAIASAVAGLDRRQVLNAETRAVHAAGWADASGRLLHLREDVGRHNALDKLLGHLLVSGVAPATGFLLITSRCSVEMVDKSAAFGGGLLVAVSAPTSLALDRAEALGITLVGIARRDGAVVFTGAERVRLAGG